MAFAAAAAAAQAGASLGAAPPEEAEAPAEAGMRLEDCVEAFEVKRTQPGLIEARISSSCRKEGDAAALSLEDYPLRAAFDARGQANFALPLLGRLTVLNWRDAAERPRAELIEFPDFDSTIQIVLIWDAEADLDLLLAESPGPFEGVDPEDPRGNVTPLRPNPEADQGYGRLALSSEGGAAGWSAEVYVLERARNPVLQGRLPRGRVEPSVEVSLADEARRKACAALLEGEARVHFTIHANLYGRTRTSRQAFDKIVCDPDAPLERRLMRLEPLDFTARR